MVFRIEVRVKRGTHSGVRIRFVKEQCFHFLDLWRDSKTKRGEFFVSS